ncbi:olfactory receptor 2T2-like [Tachyglossus aculeatus]|uniref:olfactory receptor 2T2-like n=1 Tax=Tachyglossus aculeatus TaxID=9261 RepID=UPI0018F3FA3E|nr:olfactory receptor 2T2-like [Tachyglossus aculeatus]
MGGEVGLLNNDGLLTILSILINLTFIVTLTENSAMMVLIYIDSQLHTPMNFLLRHLSLMDAKYSCTTVPKMMVDKLTGQKSTSFWGCISQIFLYWTLLRAECFLLGPMVYDRYVAIGHALCYAVLMNQRRCIQVAAGSWLLGGADGFLNTPLVMSFPYCASRVINNFFYEVLALLKLSSSVAVSCVDISVYESVMYVCCVLMFSVLFALITFCYGRIVAFVLGMRSAHAWKNTLATCS